MSKKNKQIVILKCMGKNVRVESNKKALSLIKTTVLENWWS